MNIFRRADRGLAAPAGPVSEIKVPESPCSLPPAGFSGNSGADEL
jgi:hypothetical protein